MTPGRNTKQNDGELTDWRVCFHQEGSGLEDFDSDAEIFRVSGRCFLISTTFHLLSSLYRDTSFCHLQLEFNRLLKPSRCSDARCDTSYICHLVPSGASRSSRPSRTAGAPRNPIWGHLTWTTGAPWERWEGWTAGRTWTACKWNNPHVFRS